MPSRDIELYIYSKGPLSCSVCVLANATERAIQNAVNLENPAGTKHGWRVSRAKTFSGGQPHPKPCELDPENRKHYLMEC